MTITLDVGHHLPVFSPVCFYCLNLDGKNFERPGTCKAFKKGIPEEIWTGEHEHSKPYKGDNGITFEPIK